jgi:hypothetical protein
MAAEAGLALIIVLAIHVHAPVKRACNMDSLVIVIKVRVDSSGVASRLGFVGVKAPRVVAFASAAERVVSTKRTGTTVIARNYC